MKQICVAHCSLSLHTGEKKYFVVSNFQLEVCVITMLGQTDVRDTGFTDMQVEFGKRRLTKGTVGWGGSSGSHRSIGRPSRLWKCHLGDIQDGKNAQPCREGDALQSRGMQCRKTSSL